MNVLVAGGTGFVGTELCRALADRGHDVTAMARHPDEASLPDAVETVAGDVTDRESVAAAVAGRDVVVNLVALSPLFEPDSGSGAHDRIHRGGTANLVAAAEDRGVDRFVQMSALGADAGGSTAYLRAKGAAEEVVRASDLDWTIVRPSVVFGDGGEFVGFTKLLTTPYVTGLPGGGSTRFQPIWVGDLAPMLADCAAGDRHVGRTYELGGHEVLTLADVTRAVYRAEGKSTVVLPVPMVLARVGLTLAGLVPGVPFGPDQYRSLRLDNTVDDNDVTAFGRDPASLRTLDDYLRSGTNDASAAQDGRGESDREETERSAA
ncbi:complex I NDUFA9 subunit family protein [Halosimplex aquaticum]|uniref:Complex I NDUFA9 subunit family protein n=1 Tax=Halosimplex aquaticum TaxID=3026162 RepID=A0ABD5Y9K3_9EURY|nr:complex I NDUFA9 subunit family protein [Halosimplex aquaticum]